MVFFETYLIHMEKLKSYGTYILITGGTSGIGKAIALQLANEGIDLILVARSEDTLSKLASELQKNYKIKVITIATDLSSNQGIQKLLEDTKQLDIGILINAAGYGSSGYFLDNPIAIERNMIHLNCEAAMVLTYEFGQRFKLKNKGAIVLFSSILAFQGTPYSANYAATKAYIQSLSEALGKEFAHHNIAIQVAAPGPTETGFSHRAKMQMKNAMQPEEIARDVLKNIGKTKTTYPGKITKILTYSLMLLPRFAKINVMRMIMKKMANV